MLPALSRIYGLKPWDLDRMTPREIEEYLIDYDLLLRQPDPLTDP